MDYTTKILHPTSGYVIQGALIPQGDVLRKTDVFNSQSGFWEKCPCPGSLNESSDVIWVRPIEVE